MEPLETLHTDVMGDADLLAVLDTCTRQGASAHDTEIASYLLEEAARRGLITVH